MIKKEIYLAGGCFWGTEKYLSRLQGVISTEVGYANGNTINPSYEDVCSQNTNYAETVKVIYNDTTSLTCLLKAFYEVIDPTSLNKQGNDVGTQYRSGIYFTDEADETEIKTSIKKLSYEYNDPIAIEVELLKSYYKAEEYHQKYLDKNPAGYCHIPNNKFKNLKNK